MEGRLGRQVDRHPKQGSTALQMQEPPQVDANITDITSRAQKWSYPETQQADKSSVAKVTYLRNRNREVVGSRAFNLEYDTPPTREEFGRYIESYLREYRLQVETYDYELVYGRDKDGKGEMTLRDVDRGESLLHKAGRVIEERSLRKDPTHREEAEEVGLHFLNGQMPFAQAGDTILWASPPGPKEQGYGNYGFIYKGKVTKLDNGEAHLAMTAIRVENPTLEQFNKAFEDTAGEEKIAHRHADEFLAKPRIISGGVTEEEIDRVLREHFSWEADPAKQERHDRVIKRIRPLFDEFYDAVLTGTREQKILYLNTTENLALKFDKEEEENNKGNVIYLNDHRDQIQLKDMTERYGYTPPKVEGSCGSTSSSNSAISAGRGETVNGMFNDGLGPERFECPACHKMNKRPRGGFLSNCKHCGSDAVSCNPEDKKETKEEKQMPKAA